MEPFGTEALTAVLALVGIVIVIAALLSGYIERSNIPQVGVFLALGAVLGPSGLGLLNVSLDSPILRIVATLSLALVLFTDAVSLSITEVRKHTRLAFWVLGPGTMLSTAMIALAGWWLLGLPAPAALILGAALASTDPVLLRGLLRRPDIPADARQALRLESGLNDVVLLPVVLAAMVFLGGASQGSGPTNWPKFAMDLFLLGPGAGVLVGLLGVATLDLVRRRVGLRRDYESLYSLGVAFAAFAAAEAVHGSGFLAVFTAGLTISALDVELCDCFLEYGETTAELALLFTFVLLGASLIWSGFTVLTLATGLFALIAILVRPVAFLASLAPMKLENRSRFIIAWFGPRGLSSLLLILLPVFAGAQGAENLFSLCCLVVVASVALHGGSIMAVGRFTDRAATVPDVPQPAPTIEDELEPVATNSSGATESEAVEISPERITIPELQQLQQNGRKVILLDVRRERNFQESGRVAVGAVRVNPDGPVESARERKLPQDTLLVAFCKCPDEKTSGRVARELKQAGWLDVRALVGGWNAWEAAGLPTAPQPSGAGNRPATDVR